MTAHVDKLAAASGIAASSPAAVQTAWDAFLATARAAWPDVTFDADKLVEHVATRLAGDELATALAAAPASDLALAVACLVQEPTAHAAFDAILGEVDAAGASTKASRDQVDEVKQLLRVQLLVAVGDKPPGIVGYRGRGPLRGWVRITATRELIRHKKKQIRDVPGDEGLGDLLVKGGEADPVLEKLKNEYRNEFAGALRDAVADLTPEDRILLRQQIVDEMSIDEVGAAYGVHRATAARWLNRARGALVGTTHKRLAERLKMPVDQVESVIRLVQSRLDASVIRYLRET